jgi:preprotein translocase subunit SecG
MGILEIISAICLILACIFIIIMVLLQDSKRGMSQTLAGGNSDNFYQRNQGRSKEAQLVKATRTAAILFFIVTLIANVFAIYFKGEDTVGGGGGDTSDLVLDLDGFFDPEI